MAASDNRNFDNPKINVITLINQFSYYSPDTIGGGTHLGWSLLVPVVSLDGDLATTASTQGQRRRSGPTSPSHEVLRRSRSVSTAITSGK
jgi:hypothetical protein